MKLGAKINSNKFLNSLRIDMKIDEKAFGELVELIRELAIEWRGQDAVDKHVMQEIYVIPSIIRGASDGFRERLPSVSSRLDEMAIEVDELILEALA